MKPKSQWAGAHDRLKRLYEQRVPADMTQKDFGRRHGIGSQSMVAQYLNGDRPLNFEAAVKFAKALGVSVYDISPEMGDWIKEELLPVLGKALRRAAMFAAIVVSVSLLQPYKSANAQDFSGAGKVGCVLCKVRRMREIMRRIMRFWRLCFLACRVSVCTISAWLRRCARPSRPRSVGFRLPEMADACGFLWPFSSQSWPRNTPTSSQLFATQ